MGDDNKMTNASSILVYTRTTIPESYPGHLANSIHFAYSNDGKVFKPLNQNYGILFALAEIDEKNVIKAKGLKNPYIFQTADGHFGILAVKTNYDGSNDQESRGNALLWLSPDLIKFEEQVLLDLQKDLYVERVICQYNPDRGIYQLYWQGVDGNFYCNTMADLKDKDSISAAEKIGTWPVSPGDEVEYLRLPEGAIPGNTITIKEELMDKIREKWSPLENIAIEVPELISAKSEEDVAAVKARAIYSDASTATKQVKWDTELIDFSKPGTYEISGTVVQDKYEFPLAVGYADPVIIRWKGKYYFVATNDNVNNIGIFVRKGDRVAEFFKEDFTEYLILDKDEERGLVQTFWAPEFHVIRGQLYIFFAVSGKEWGPQCHVMKLKEGGEITDPDSWSDPIRVLKKDGSYLCETGITLDMTYFELEGVSYVVWSERYNIETPDDSGSMLYIATVDSEQPWQLTSDPVLLSRPLYGWENVEGTINNEGPYPLITDSHVYIAYSGGAANGYTYAVGLLSIEKGKDLLDVNNWYKRPTPALSFYSIAGEYGPGHNAFYTDENGDVMITYHAEPDMGGNKRCSAIRRVHFDIDGEPRLDLSYECDLNSELTGVKMKVIVQE